MIGLRVKAWTRVYEDLRNRKTIPCILEVDLEYPENCTIFKTIIRLHLKDLQKICQYGV